VGYHQPHCYPLMIFCVSSRHIAREDRWAQSQTLMFCFSVNFFKKTSQNMSRPGRWCEDEDDVRMKVWGFHNEWRVFLSSFEIVHACSNVRHKFTLINGYNNCDSHTHTPTTYTPCKKLKFQARYNYF
jgi:hypothetical protein